MAKSSNSGRLRRQQESETEQSDENTEDKENKFEVDVEDIDEEELIKNENGELMHPETGIIVDEDNIDRGPEWRAYNSEERNEKSRTGDPMRESIHDRGLTTDIDWRNKDANGQSISSEQRSKMNRLRKWQDRIRTKDSGERNLQYALSEIDRMASALGIPQSVREVASVVYRRALNNDLIRGRSIEGVASAALYIACRKESMPRSLEETSSVSRVEKKEIGRTYRYLISELRLEMSPVDPAQYVGRFCSELDLSEDTITKAKQIIAQTTKMGLLSGKSPTGFAAAAIYAASLLQSEGKTQREVAEVAGVTEVTIRNRYQEQIDALDM